MTKGQERNNRSQGQRIRRVGDRIDQLLNNQQRQAEVVAQHDRDIKLIKARLNALEREQARK